MAIHRAPSFVPWSEPGRTTLELRTGTWRTRRPVYVEATPPCRTACPASEPIALWIERARAGDYAGAWSLIREENPLPAVTGRVCAHHCESACNRGGWDGAVAIHALERFVGDWGLRFGVVEPPPIRRTERIAIVGGGPAGLACAWHLGRLGYHATIFEADRELGGLLRHGIPAYRLPRTVLDREIELILALGIDVQTGRPFTRQSWASLEEFAAIFVATGAAMPLRLGVPGAEAMGVTDGVEFLRTVNGGGRPELGARVAVIGGGSTAMDVARTARRLGVPSVTVVALESADAMPAIAEELVQAVAEGVRIENGLGVRSVRTTGGRVSQLRLGTAHLGRSPDGAITAVFAGDDQTVIDVDSVLLALGQRPDLLALPEDVIVASGIARIDERGATSAARIFAGGDLTSRERTVSHAVGSGTRAARAIHTMLSGAHIGPFVAPHVWVTPDCQHTVSRTEIGTHAFRRTRRTEEREQPSLPRVGSFVEVIETFEESAARLEAERCFTCGRCVHCDTCFLVCPDIAIARVDGEYRIADDHCKGCGLCARECPRGALHMHAEGASLQ
jgi:NADPH-dependent glutamate synthase beta subunit-like oxidoreductase